MTGYPLQFAHQQHASEVIRHTCAIQIRLLLLLLLLVGHTHTHVRTCDTFPHSHTFCREGGTEL